MVTRARSDVRKEGILRAALTLLQQGGPDSVSMAELAVSTGLSRPAIYQYFASKEHVLGELVINDMADLSNEIDRLVGSLDDPMEQVRLWIHYSLAYLSSEEHAAIRKISMDALPEGLRGELRAMHGYVMMSLITSLSAIGVEDPSALCGMIFGALSASAKRVEEGADLVLEARAVEAFVVSGIESYARFGSTTTRKT
jgi:AcrR family transcriptional regulator